MQKALYKKLSKFVPHFYGYSKGGLPLGDDQHGDIDFRDKIADEDLESRRGHDPLVEVDDRLLTRSMYYAQGFTIDDRLFLRKPALLQCIDYDKELQKLGWRLRVCDAFRPAEVQQKGFCWGLSQVLYHHEDLTMEEFKKLLKRVVTKGGTTAEIKRLRHIVREADQFFLYVTIKKEPKDILLIAAANLGLVDVPLDKTALTAHNTGGVVDIEWVEEETGKMVNVGVPVDTQGAVAAFPYFETKVATLFKFSEEFKRHRLASLKRRKAYYKKRVEKDDFLQRYLSSCGVDVAQFLEDETYFNHVWNEIRLNRRVVLALAHKVGMLPFGRESWHFDCNDERGGIHFKRTGHISGAGSYALHHGQKTCAWGCATPLYVKGA